MQSQKKRRISNFDFWSDKVELSKIVNYLIEESNYLPLKFENETSVEVKFIQDLEWKIPLGII